MATVKQGGLLKGATGRLGNLVTYELNGVQVIRALPGTRKRKPTALQEIHRRSFKIQHRIAQSLRWKIINRIWNQFSYKGGMNAYNRFIQINRQVYGPTGSMDFPELMVLSQGNVSPAIDFKTSQEGNNLVLQWTPGNTNRYTSDADRLNIVLLHSRSSLEVIETGVERRAGQALVPFPGDTKETPEGYVFWSSSDNRNFSPSIYWRCSQNQM